MSFIKKIIKTPSSDKIHNLKGVIYIPSGKPKAILHIVHGMTEHIGRYEPIMSHFAEQGYLVAGYDHLGHGKTATSKDELGFIAEKNGYKHLVDDVHVFGEKLRKANKGIPYFLFGHSMGSFIVRLAAEKYPTDADKLIICGTGGANPMALIGLFITDILMLISGKRSHSKFVDKMAFGSYNKGFEEKSGSAWLSKDTEYLEERKTDELCNFGFTVSAMHDLIKLNRLSNTSRWFRKYPKDLPTLIISGDKDPVGDHGKGVTKVYKKLQKSKVSNVTFKLYEGCRHEIHNDSCRQEMYNDVLNFIEG